MTPTRRFRFHVVPSSGVPIYRQLIDQVRAQIATGRLTAGDFLPSVRQVAADLAVNPMTVSKAYSLLERDGVVELVRGQGMCVADQPAGSGMSKNRGAELASLARNLAVAARKASLSPEEVCALVNTAFEELDDERSRTPSR